MSGGTYTWDKCVFKKKKNYFRGRGGGVRPVIVESSLEPL